jgi:hypothetical protein
MIPGEDLSMLRMNLGVLHGLVDQLGACEKEMEAMSRAPDFEGKQMALIALEAARYMHARLYVTAPLVPARSPNDPEAAALVQLSAMKLDDALAPLVAADLISEFAAKHVVTILRDQIAMRDEAASTRLEVPRTLAAIATLSRPESGDRRPESPEDPEDPEMPGPTFTVSQP